MLPENILYYFKNNNFSNILSDMRGNYGFESFPADYNSAYINDTFSNGVIKIYVEYVDCNITIRIIARDERYFMVDIEILDKNGKYISNFTKPVIVNEFEKIIIRKQNLKQFIEAIN